MNIGLSLDRCPDDYSKRCDVTARTLRSQTAGGPVPPWGSDFAAEQVNPAWTGLLVSKDSGLGRTPASISKIRRRLDGRPAFAQWDHIFKTNPSRWRANPDRLKVVGDKIVPVKTWTDQGTSDLVLSFIKGGTGTWVFDTLSDRVGSEVMIDAAHRLTHAVVDRSVTQSVRSRRHGRCAWQLAKFCCELAVAKALSLPIDESGAANSRRSVLPAGLKVAFTTSSSSRKGRMAFDMCARELKFDDTLAVVCCGVLIGHDALTGGASHRNAAARQPVRVVVAGWETAAWFASMPLRKPRPLWQGYPPDDIAYTTTLDDLMHPGLLVDYVDDYNSSAGLRVDGLTDVDGMSVVGSDWVSPPLPCDMCFAGDTDYEMSLERPLGRMPKEWRSDPAWRAYGRDVTRQLRLIRKARQDIGLSDKKDDALRRRQWLDRVRKENKQRRFYESVTGVPYCGV